MDGEAGTQIGRALLVGDVLVPDVHRPLVGRHIEQSGVLAVGHRHPVLAAEERRRDGDGLALVGARRAGTVGVVVDRTTVLVQALGPGDLVDEGEAADELAVGAVQYVEEAVAVGGAGCLDGLAAFLVIEGDQLVDAVVVPAIMRGGLEVPLDRAVIRVDGQTRGGIQVVARTQVRVPRRRVAGAEQQRVGVRVVVAAQPGGCATGFPQVARPGLAGFAAGDAAFDLLAILPDVAHVTFDGRTGPQQLAILRIVGFHLAHHAEFTTGYAGDQLAFDDQRRRSQRVAGLVVGDGLLPDHLAGVLVQRDQLGVEGAESAGPAAPSPLVTIWLVGFGVVDGFPGR